jgi:hypothetical protein
MNEVSNGDWEVSTKGELPDGVTKKTEILMVRGV